MNEENKDVAVEETVTMSKQEYETALQAEADRRVTQALETARKKWDQEFSTKIDTHLKDYEKKAQMSPDQLRQLDLDEKLKLLEAKEQEYARKTREIDIAQKLQEKKLSSVLTKFVYSDNMEEVEQNIVTLEQLIMGMVNEEVEQRISSNKPKAVSISGLTAESFKKMSLAERSALYNQNPQLFKELAAHKGD